MHPTKPSRTDRSAEADSASGASASDSREKKLLWLGAILLVTAGPVYCLCLYALRDPLCVVFSVCCLFCSYLFLWAFLGGSVFAVPALPSPAGGAGLCVRLGRLTGEAVCLSPLRHRTQLRKIRDESLAAAEAEQRARAAAEGGVGARPEGETPRSPADAEVPGGGGGGAAAGGAGPSYGYVDFGGSRPRRRGGRAAEQEEVQLSEFPPSRGAGTRFGACGCPLRSSGTIMRC